MSRVLQLRRGTTARSLQFVGEEGEVTVDLDLGTLRVHDGETAGGRRLATKAELDAAVLSAVVADGDYGDITVSGAGSIWAIDPGAVTDVEVAAANKDGVAGTASMRTLGTGAQQAAAGDHGHATLAPLASPAFTGNPTAPTQTAGNNSTRLANTEFVTAAVAAAIVPAGATGAVQYNNAGAPGGASSLLIDASGNPLLIASSPTTPASGRVSVYGASIAGRTLPSFKDADNAAMPLQSHLGMARRLEWTPVNNSATPGAFGGGITLTGTNTARAVAAGSFFSWARKVSIVSAAGAGSVAEIRASNANHFGLGDVAGVGGFTFVCRFAVADAAAVANARMAVGMFGLAVASGALSGEPSAMTDLVAVGCDSAGTTLHVIHNDAAGAATTVNLGANFPSSTLSTDVYELALHAKPNGSEVGYRVHRLNTGHVASGTISTNLPANTVLLGPRAHRCNGTTALAVDLAFLGLYVETDN